MKEQIKNDFSYKVFETLNETSKYLISMNGEAVLVAGSTDILVQMERKEINNVVSLNKLSELVGIQVVSDEVRIGALTTLTEISESKELLELFPALCDAAREMASPQIRNKGTIGGNICNASPAADTAPSLLVYDAKVEIYNDGTTRVVELSNFFVGPGKSVLELGDIVTAVILPVKKVASGFTKIGKRKALEISIMSMAISLELEGNKILNSKVACGSVGPTPMMAPKTEKLLNGLTVNSEADLQEAVEMVRTEVTPIDDIRGTATYRVRMAGISLKRLIMRIMEGAE